MWGYNQGHYGQCRPVRLPQCTVPPSTCPRSCIPDTSYAPSCSAEKNYRWTCSSKLEARRSCSAPPRKRLTIEFTPPENKRISRPPRRPRSVGLEPTVTKLKVERRTVSKIPKRDTQNKQTKTQKVQQTPKLDNSKSGTTQTNQALILLHPKITQNAPAKSSDESVEVEECGVDASSQTSESSVNPSVKSSDREESCDEEKCGVDASSQKSSVEKEEFCDEEKCGIEAGSQKSKSNESVSIKSSGKVEFCDNKTCGMDVASQKSKSSGTPSVKSGERVQYCANERCGMDDESQKSKSSGSVSVRSSEKMNIAPVDNVEDHEYLHFLLGITEDILRNNMYTNRGMDEVFESHLAANRGRLNEARMRNEIEHLKIELNYPLEKSSESLCQCDKEVVEEPLANCRCCPGFHTDPATNTNATCGCVNPECPGKKIEVELNNNLYSTTKGAAEVPTLIQLERQFYSVSQYENVVPHSDAGDTKRDVTSPCGPSGPKEDAAQEDRNCIDPAHCDVPLGNISRKEGSDKSKVVFEQGDDALLEMKTTSTVKIVASEDKDNISQVVFYNSQIGEVCHCTATLRKTALKIQVDEQDENQEYILVDGPVCMPKTMLEGKTIPVLIENVSSMSIDSDLDVHKDQQRVSNVPSLSKMNLFLQKQPHGEEVFKDSVSFVIREGTRWKSPEADYDMTPEREMVLELEKQQEQPIVTPKAVTVKAENRSKQSNVASADTSEAQSILKNDTKSGTLVDPHFGVLKYADTQPCEMESKRPSLFDHASDEGAEYEGVDQDIVDRIFGSHFSGISSDEDTDSKEVAVSNARSISSSGGICANIRCQSRKATSEKSEGEVSDNESVPQRPPPHAKSNSSTRRKNCCSSSSAAAAPVVVGTTKPDRSNGDVKYRTPDERPSQRHGSDFENKYHYLLQDASTSMTSADFRQEGPVSGGAVLLPLPTAPPISYYDQPHGDGSIHEREPSLEEEDEYHIPSLVEIQPLRTSIAPQYSKMSSSDTDDLSDDKLYTPKVFEYSTRAAPVKPVEAPLPMRAKPFEYAYPRKRGSVSGSSDPVSGSFSKHSDETENLLPPTYVVASKTSSVGLSSSSDEPIDDKTSADQLKVSDTSIPKKDLKVRYTPPDETEPYDHQDIIKKLDEIPEQDPLYNQQNTVKAITDKLEEFRTIDRNDNARRFKYVNPEENFEIRRASFDDKPDENVRNTPKPKPTCCGLGPKSRRAK